MYSCFLLFLEFQPSSHKKATKRIVFYWDLKSPDLGKRFPMEIEENEHALKRASFKLIS